MVLQRLIDGNTRKCATWFPFLLSFLVFIVFEDSFFLLLFLLVIFLWVRHTDSVLVVCNVSKTIRVLYTTSTSFLLLIYLIFDRVCINAIL